MFFFSIWVTRAVGTAEEWRVSTWNLPSMRSRGDLVAWTFRGIMIWPRIICYPRWLKLIPWCRVPYGDAKKATCHQMIYGAKVLVLRPYFHSFATLWLNSHVVIFFVSITMTSMFIINCVFAKPQNFSYFLTKFHSCDEKFNLFGLENDVT